MQKKHLLKLLFCSLITLFALTATAQTQVTGKVIDESGQTVPGVTVVIKGTTRGANTDVNGNFKINASTNDVLVFSSIGYIRKEVSLNGRSQIIIQLTTDNRRLNDVVVVGYGVQRRRDITGSVGSVQGEAFKDQPITSPVAALEGRVAGVNVVQASGAPDATPTITIRGVESFNQPAPLYIVDGIRVPDLNSLNVQDIASIEVLKDASSAAIYGASGAGGVLLVTTKKGSGTSSKPNITFSQRYGITRPKLVTLLDKNGFIQLENLVRPSVFANANKLDTLTNTDWVHTLYRNANEQNYNLSISGASPVVNYLFSGFYNGQNGVLQRNYSNIGGARINTDYKLGKFIQIGEQVAFSQRQTAPPIGAQADFHNAPFRTQPIIPVYSSNGGWGTEPSGYTGLAFSGPNPLGAIMSANVQNTKNNLQTNVYADIKLPLHLNFRTNVGYNYYLETQNYFQNSFNFGSVVQPDNSLNRFSLQSTQLLIDYLLTYNQNFGKHHIDALAGYEQITNTFSNINAMETSVGLPGYSFIQTSNSGLAVSGQYDPQGLIKSEFGRVNYNYAGKYYLSGSIRRDANFTEFGPNKQSGVFPAGSIGWTVGEEHFFEPLKKVINNLKFRASYGTLGNSAIAPYQYTASIRQFNSTSGVSAGGQNFAPGAPLLIANSTVNIPNSAVSWETTTETNLGLDGDALAGRLYYTFEYYNKTTSDMLYGLPVAPSTGITQPYYANVGKVRNRGFEFLVGFRDKAGAFGYDVSVNAGFNKNMVVSLNGTATGAFYDGYNFYNNGDTGFNMMPNQTITITKAGEPFGSFYGYKVQGIFKTDAEAASQKVNGNTAHAGDLIYQDVNGDGKIDANDRQIIGNPNPKMVYGISARFNYHNFDLQLLFNGVMGVQLFNGVKAYEQYPFADGNTTSRVFNDSFLGNNGLTSQPRLGMATPGGFTLDPNQNYTSVNSYFVENGSYLKLKNAQLGYTFSNGFLRKIAVKTLRVFVMANNVFVITKYTGLDPELASAYTTSGFGNVTTRGLDVVTNYPQTRIYSAGVDINF
jgi:TonB-linked SusC/RagA family outer membrane protein